MDLLIADSGNNPDGVIITPITASNITIYPEDTKKYNRTSGRKIGLEVVDSMMVKPVQREIKTEVQPRNIIIKANRGEEKVSGEIYSKRLSVCNQCEFREDKRCKHMGCNCDLSRKAWLKEQDCPMKKWGFDNVNENTELPKGDI